MLFQPFETFRYTGSSVREEQKEVYRWNYEMWINFQRRFSQSELQNIMLHY